MRCVFQNIRFHKKTSIDTPQQTIQSPDKLYKAPTDNTKTRHIRQSPNRQYKAPVSSDLQRPGLVWGVTPDWYGGRPGPVWGPKVRIINIGCIELGFYFCRFFEKPKMSKNRRKSKFLNVLRSASPVRIQPNIPNQPQMGQKTIFDITPNIG